jgi:hypothetical protein
LTSQFDVMKVSVAVALEVREHASSQQFLGMVCILADG